MARVTYPERIQENLITKEITRDEATLLVPVGISNHHIHLSQEHLEALFGPNYHLTNLKPLSQPGQFAAQETVTIIGPKGLIEGVRVLGPVRRQTQVEISMTDAYKLGIRPPVRDSGDLEGTPGVVIVGRQGAVTLGRGVILPWRHIHMHSREAEQYGFHDGDRVRVQIDGVRGLLLENVLVRVDDQYSLEMHLDTDEANGCLLHNGTEVAVVKDFSIELYKH